MLFSEIKTCPGFHLFLLNQNLYQNVWSYLSLLLFGESAMSCLIHTLC